MHMAGAATYNKNALIEELANPLGFAVPVDG